MSYKLVIAEKPSVAQSIAKVIGADKREDGLIKHMISELEENDKKLMHALVYEWKIDEKESRDA